MDWMTFEERVPVNMALNDANIDYIIDRTDVEVDSYDFLDDAGQQHVEMVFGFTDEETPFVLAGIHSKLTIQVVFVWLIQNAPRFHEMTKDEFTTELEEFAKNY